MATSLPVTTSFDPDAAALDDAGIFGLPIDPVSAAVHVVPVPFDATTSYRKGTARGPAAVLRASLQVDLFDVMTGKPWQQGICMLDADPRIAKWNDKATRKADKIIALGGRIGTNKQLQKDLEHVNQIGADLNELVFGHVSTILDARKLPVLLGGDHSTPFGAIHACSERFPGLGVLHFDAHADLREAYEGFEWSHASIMNNVVTRLPKVSKLVQVGIRDLGEREHAMIASSKSRIHTLLDVEWGRARADGTNLRELVRRTIAQLPDHVYVSFDVDGLDPTLCPNTGTPVPGGLIWHDAMLWLEELGRSKKRVVGLDLNEVSPGAHDGEDDSWDAIVGARLLYRLIGTALLTR